jgi:hypothetical protein
MNSEHSTTNRSPWQGALMVLIGMFGAATLSLVPALAGAADPASLDAAFKQFQRATAGDKAAIDAAARQFGSLSAAEPRDPVLLAYSGAATSMLATTTFLPWRKLSHAEDGLAQIDKALSMLTPAHDAPLHRGTPASLETRFVAANTFLALPSMFNRRPRGAKLLDEVLKSPQFAASPLPFRGAVWLRAGQDAAGDKRIDDARRWFGEVIKSGAPQAGAAQAKLKDLS